MRIRKARTSDTAEIYRIASANHIDRVDSSNNGFLVSGFSEADYVDKVRNLEHFYVLEVKKKVKAFIFAYKKEDVKAKDKVNSSYFEHADGDFSIIKQICVDKDGQSKGYGTMLYNYIVDVLTGTIYVAVVSEPYNEASVNFHLKNGFKLAYEIEADDKRTRQIYRYERALTKKEYNDNLLEQQYQVAVDLYLHEDNLNWSKLNNLFYLTGGLVVALSVLASLSVQNLFVSIFVVSLLGFVSALLFSVTIASGVKYMNSRKQSVMDIEKIIIEKKGTNVVIPAHGRYNKLLTLSPTSKVMVYIPRLILATWFCVGVFSLVQIL